MIDQLIDWWIAQCLYLLNQLYVYYTAVCLHIEKQLFVCEKAVCLHGQMSQPKRLGALNKFKSGGRDILICTDVASRGLDIPGVDLVVQVEPPKDTETYIHRSGRTARAGRSGTCITFYTLKQKSYI